jgi:hypothetical protein
MSTVNRARLNRTRERCLRAFEKLEAMHQRHVNSFNSYWVGRRIMRAVRLIRQRSRDAYELLTR